MAKPDYCVQIENTRKNGFLVFMTALLAFVGGVFLLYQGITGLYAVFDARVRRIAREEVREHIRRDYPPPVASNMIPGDHWLFQNNIIPMPHSSVPFEVEADPPDSTITGCLMKKLHETEWKPCQ
jgi:hypothetical protein